MAQPYTFQVTHEQNNVGRDFVVGDIHGMYDMLMGELEDVAFDRKKDRLFSVGDMIDRGPKNTECLDLINEPWFFPVVGNHEDMMCRYVLNKEAASWIINGGKWGLDLDDNTLAQYVDLIVTKVPLTRAVYTDHGLIGICHAQPRGPRFTEAPANRREANTLMWGRNLIEHKTSITMEDVAFTIHGHTPLENVVKLGDQVYIDTAAVFGGKLTLLQIQGAYS